MPPPLRGTNQPKRHDAEPEVDKQAQVDLKQLVPGRRRERRHENVVSRVAQQHGEQRLHKVRDHRWFRHRASLNGAQSAYATPLPSLPNSLLPF